MTTNLGCIVEGDILPVCLYVYIKNKQKQNRKKMYRQTNKLGGKRKMQDVFPDYDVIQYRE